MYKFRTMRTDAEKTTGAVLASKDDPRVTRIGRFLRKSRLDELPQLWNILRGDMSLVGPRPERPELLSTLAAAIPFFEERMRDVKPGLTGLAQVSLGYSGDVLAGSAVEAFQRDMQNPFGIDEAEGAQADDMRMKLLYDMAYVAALEDIGSYLLMELRVLTQTPLVMLKGLGR
jgi:lipopolysaccharide/colanic/teichoic acid biosynthesis glycosyltransferase